MDNKMKTKQTPTTLTAQLSPHELWFLAEFFAPGVIYGIEDPGESLSEEEKGQARSAAYTSLMEAGVIEAENAQRVKVDEMLGAMVYSCIHSAHVLVVNQPASQATLFFHFLPEWQLMMRKVDEAYELTLFKDRETLFDTLAELFTFSPPVETAPCAFSIRQRELELAAYLFETSKVEEATAIINQAEGEKPSATDFLQGYSNPTLHLVFDSLYHRNDEIRLHERKHELLVYEGMQCWLSHDLAGEENIPIIHIHSLSSEQLKERFLRMIPADK
jgi:hypothetical protein